MKRYKYSLMFHDVYNCDPCESGFQHPSSNSFKISKNDFIRFIDLLILNAEKNKIPISDIFLTVDDGGESSLWIARELSKRNLIGHFFISSFYIGNNGFCSKEAILEISKLGHFIGNHSHTHPRVISKLSFDQIYKEWFESTSILQNILGKQIVEASIPGGYYSNESFEILRKLGYKRIYTSKPTNLIRVNNDIEIIGRFTIRNFKPVEYYLKYINKISFLRIKMYIRWILLVFLKKIFGKKFNILRKIFFKNNIHR